jgi:hypothetical protein
MVKIIIVGFYFLYLFGCASHKVAAPVGALIDNAVVVYDYTDISGTFKVQRKNSFKDKKIFFQRIIYQDSFDQSVEKMRSIMQVGGIYGHDGVSIRPVISQMQVWMEGKEFNNQIKLNLKSKSLDIVATGKAKKAEKSSVAVGKEHKSLCFFQQLPECLKVVGALRKLLADKSERYELTVIMESYPFNDLIYNDFPNQLLFKANVSQGTQDLIDSKNETVLNVEFGGQVVNLKFTKGGQFIGQFWVAQGISMVPQDN